MIRRAEIANHPRRMRRLEAILLGVDTREPRLEPIEAEFAEPARAGTRPGWPAVAALSLGLGLIGGAAGGFGVAQLAPRRLEVAAAPSPPTTSPVRTQADVDLAPLQATVAALQARQADFEQAMLDLNLEGERARLESHGRRLAVLEAAPPRAEAEQLAVAVAALQERLRAAEAEAGQARAAIRELRRLEGRVAANAAALEAKAAQTEADALRLELAAAQQAADAADVRAGEALARARLAFAFTALAEAAQSGAPFPEAHANLARGLPASPHVAALAPLAQTGAPSRAELAGSFAATAGAVERALRQQQSAGAGLFGQVQAALADQVSVRPVEAKGLPQSRLEQARAALSQQNLAEAAAALSLLSGPAAEAAKPWLDAARRRLEIERRLGAIRTELSEG